MLLEETFFCQLCVLCRWIYYIQYINNIHFFLLASVHFVCCADGFTISSTSTTFTFSCLLVSTLCVVQMDLLYPVHQQHSLFLACLCPLCVLCRWIYYIQYINNIHFFLLACVHFVCCADGFTISSTSTTFTFSCLLLSTLCVVQMDLIYPVHQQHSLFLACLCPLCVLCRWIYYIQYINNIHFFLLASVHFVCCADGFTISSTSTTFTFSYLLLSTLCVVQMDLLYLVHQQHSLFLACFCPLCVLCRSIYYIQYINNIHFFLLASVHFVCCADGFTISSTSTTFTFSCLLVSTLCVVQMDLLYLVHKQQFTFSCLLLSNLCVVQMNLLQYINNIHFFLHASVKICAFCVATRVLYVQNISNIKTPSKYI